MKNCKTTRILIDEGKKKLALSKRKQEQVHVDDAPGLYLQVYPSGNADWRTRIRWVRPLTGRKYHSNISLGQASKVTYIEAVARFDEQKKRAAEGISPDAHKMTLAGFFDTVYTPWAKRNKRSVRDDISRFNHHLRKSIGNLRLSEVRLMHLQRLISDMESSKSIALVNRIIALLKACFRQANLAGLLASNPAAMLRMRKENNARSRTLSKTELNSLYSSMAGDSDRLSVLLIRWLLATGMRISEALNSKHVDVDDENRLLKLHRTKNGKSRFAAMSDEAMIVMMELRQLRQNDYLFPGREQNAMSRPTNSLKRILERAGILGVTFHDMRRTACSLLVNAGIPLLDASKYLGHSSVAVTAAHYAVLDNTRLHEAAAKISDVLRNAAAQSTGGSHD